MFLSPCVVGPYGMYKERPGQSVERGGRAVSHQVSNSAYTHHLIISWDVSREYIINRNTLAMGSCNYLISL